MTVSLSSDRSPGRPRRDDLMSRTAIIRVLACLSTMLAQPAYAVPVYAAPAGMTVHYGLFGRVRAVTYR